jgi:hypothetical protein
MAKEPHPMLADYGPPGMPFIFDVNHDPDVDRTTAYGALPDTVTFQPPNAYLKPDWQQEQDDS